ncbi:unnamed protein product [Effrenium voratum]|uniref:C3H1-type domain-containing protein n=1 Tax=Effrenium voratum TaxID=2562239 RepID=A0AA36J7F0_9DINO|nr:unnamed protein product [Effrenium voratum]
MRTWLAEHLGQVAAGKITLLVVLAVDGRASGRAVLGFESWEAAKAALLLFAGGKLMKVPALEGRRYSERLVLVRPVRPDEALRRAESLAEPGELPALAPFPTALNQLFGGPKYCFAFQKGQCQRGESCRYLHEKAPAGAIKPKPCFDFRLGNCARGTRCPYAHDAPRARSG